ncbi:MAG: hypothetical protein ACRDDM_08345 [Paraclostridium sp.]
MENKNLKPQEVDFTIEESTEERGTPGPPGEVGPCCGGCGGCVGCVSHSVAWCEK